MRAFLRHPDTSSAISLTFLQHMASYTYAQISSILQDVPFHYYDSLVWHLGTMWMS